jgi:uracil-DNA glycosylase family 4
MSCGKIDLHCRKCRLSSGRTQVVPGKGSCRSRIVFVGEAPGKDEDFEGEPFVGRAGKLLDEALADAGIERGEVYITNLVKCRPPKNRRPRKDEIAACSGHLSSELEELRPTVVCALGQTVAKSLFAESGSMKELVGKVVPKQMAELKVTAVIAYHPAACLYRRSNIKKFRNSIQRAVEISKRQ